MSHAAEQDTPTCPHECADVVTGEPYRIRPSNPEHPEDGWYCPSCWETVSPPD